MLTSSDIVNGNIDQIIKADLSKNETRLSPLFNSQVPEDIDQYTATTEKILEDNSNIPITQPKTFTVHSVKQVIKEIDIKPNIAKKDNIKKIDNDNLKNLSSKTNTAITNDDDLEVAKSKALDNYKNVIKKSQNSNLKQIAKLNKSSSLASHKTPLSNISSSSLASSSTLSPLDAYKAALTDKDINQKFNLNNKVVPNQYSKTINKFQNAQMDGHISTSLKFKSDKALSSNTKKNIELASSKYKESKKQEINVAPSFSLAGKTINKFVHPDGSSDDDITGLTTASLPSIAKNVNHNSPLFGSNRIPDVVGTDAYNKMRKVYDTVKDFSNCMDLDDVFSFQNDVKDSGSILDAFNDLLNSAINYDLGDLIKCFEPVVKMLDIKSVNKIVDKVGYHGSMSIFDAMTSKGDKDKILDSFHRTRRVLKRTNKSFEDQSVRDMADNIASNMAINKEDFYKSSYPEAKSLEEDDPNISVLSMQGIKNDISQSKDFINYSIGEVATDLVSTAPVF